MEHEQYVWCQICNRAFIVLLSRKPEDGEFPSDFSSDFYNQLAVRETRRVLPALCPFEECGGDVLNFWWWETVMEFPQARERYPFDTCRLLSELLSPE